MANIVTGIIEFIGQTTPKQSKDGKSTFHTRELVINARRFDPYTGEPTRDNPVSLELRNDNCKRLDTFKVGDIVDASYTLEGTKYLDKQTSEPRYFTKVSCYKVEPHTVATRQQQPAPQPTPPQPEPFPHQPFDHTPPQPTNGGLPF